MKPSTMPRARSSSDSSREKKAGSRRVEELGISAWSVISVATQESLPLLRRNGLEQSIDQLIRVEIVGAGVEVEHQAMAKHGRRNRLHVGEIDVVFARKNRS